jgi:formylglycine-generating enzyme required for sulfatase activity
MPWQTLGVHPETALSGTLGDYKLTRQLGASVMGQTFLAEHLFLHRHFVLKVLSQTFSQQPDFLQRFEEHVSALATLDHPHLVKIHNVSHAQGYYFLVTDAIVDERGTSTNLYEYLKQAGRRLDEATLLEILLQLADALDYSHSLDINGIQPIHRGLKPSNILVRQGASHPEVFISDFGISTLVGALQAVAHATGTVLNSAAAAEFASLSGTESIDLTSWLISSMETLAYLAPEQCLGDEAQVTSAADVYAFGALVYTAIAGESPSGLPTPLSEIAPEYHWNWDALVRSCMQSDPTKRPAQLVTAVRAVQHHTAPRSTAPRAENVYFQGDTRPVDSTQPSLRSSGPRIERPEVDLNPERAFQIDTTVKVYQPAPKTFSDVDPLLTETIVIPGGTYWQGSNDGKRDEVPKHRVTLRSFAIDVHPVTNEQFVRFLTVMGGEKDSYHRDLIRLRDSRIKRSGGKLGIESGYAKHPVVGVTWYGAAAYARWVGRRLPTEAEWEVAASGSGAEWAYPTGENIDKTLANYFSADTTPVGSHPANALGLFDMAGNVYEWCYDWYDYNYYEKALQEPDNPEGPVQGVYRVLRGGCWKSLKEDLRCSRRHRNNPGTVNGTYGFRCAADVDPVNAT